MPLHTLRQQTSTTRWRFHAGRMHPARAPVLRMRVGFPNLVADWRGEWGPIRRWDSSTFNGFRPGDSLRGVEVEGNHLGSGPGRSVRAAFPSLQPCPHRDSTSRRPGKPRRIPSSVYRRVSCTLPRRSYKPRAAGCAGHAHQLAFATEPRGREATDFLTVDRQLDGSGVACVAVLDVPEAVMESLIANLGGFRARLQAIPVFGIMVVRMTLPFGGCPRLGVGTGQCSQPDAPPPMTPSISRRSIVISSVKEYFLTFCA